MLSLLPTRRKNTTTAPTALHRFFEGFPTDFFQGLDTMKVGVPAFNVYRDQGNFVVEASLPGYSREDITVEMRDDLLTISGTHKEEKKEEEKDYYYREFSSGSFTRSVRLPSPVDPASLKAKFDKGILKITLPDTETDRQTHKINVE